MNLCLAAMTAILLLSAALAAAGLNADLVWHDEILALASFVPFEPAFDPAKVLASFEVYAPDHLPLYYWLGALWGQLAGWSQVTHRCFSLLAGLLTLAWLYRFAADALDRRVALIACANLAGSAFVINYFHEIRLYTLMMALVILHTWAYWRLAYRGKHGTRHWTLFIGSGVSLLYTHNLALITIAALGMSHLLHAPRVRRSLRIIGGWILCGVLFLPIVPSLLSGSFSHGSSERATQTGELLLALLQTAGNGISIVWLPLALTIGYALTRRPARPIFQLLSFALCMLLALLFLNTAFDLIPMTRVRYFLNLWWLPPILTAYALVSLPRWKSVAPVLLALWWLAGAIFARSPELSRYFGLDLLARSYPPLHRAVDHLRGQTRESDFLLGFTDEPWLNHDRDFMGGFGTIDYYFGVQLGIDAFFIDANAPKWQVERDARRAWQDQPALLFAYDPGLQAAQAAIVRDSLAPDLLVCDALAQEPNLVIQRWRHRLFGCGPPDAIQWRQDIGLVDFGAAHDPDAGELRALLWWRPLEPSRQTDFNISLQAFTDKGEKVAQIDRHLDGSLLPWSVIAMPTAEFPAGRHRLMLIVYERTSGAKLPSSHAADGVAPGFTPLLDFTIE